MARIIARRRGAFQSSWIAGAGRIHGVAAAPRGDFPTSPLIAILLPEIDLEEAELTSGRERWQSAASSISAGVARAKE
jgi:hypothetical protein